MAKILLIDDDDDLTLFLRAALKQHGHEVHYLRRAEEEAKEMLGRTEFQLVLLDNHLPGLHGIEFLKDLRERGVTVPVILMTGAKSTACKVPIEASILGVPYVIKGKDSQTLLLQLLPHIQKAFAPAPGTPAAPRPPAGPLVGWGEEMLEVYKLIGQFARSDRTVLIRGETGTGKELVANALWQHSLRAKKPFLPINCSAISEQLFESELFGHEKGAFTGADRRRIGKFEQCNGGTVFLDEIGDMPAQTQAKMLRLLQEQRFERVGDNETIATDVRILAATNQDLEAFIAQGKFRSDLFYRLNGLTIPLPPLRERLDDLPDLAAFFLARFTEQKEAPPASLADGALERLRSYRWPGNVRELQSVLHRAARVCRGGKILPGDLDLPAPPSGDATEGTVAGLRDAIRRAWDADQQNLWPWLHDLLEQELVSYALAHLDQNQSDVALRLAMNRGTVIKRMKKYDLK